MVFEIVSQDEPDRPIRAPSDSEALRELFVRLYRAQPGAAAVSAVYPYARALVEGGRPLSRGQLAAGIQLAAGVGAEGVVLWGSSGDYQACAPAG